jgi:putative endonuclease
VLSVADTGPPYRGHLDLGRRGEEAAGRFLAGLGFRILERGFRTRAGEIDLVALEGDTLVFVEVKTRRTLACGSPAEAVNARKQARIERAAALYLSRRPAWDPPVRFDVVEILSRPGGRARIRLLRNAFGA